MGGEDEEKPRPSPEMNQRMGAVLKAKGNDVCADCPAKRPLWVSFLAGRVEKERKMGVMVCTKCAQFHHFELGDKRCLIKYLKMAHEFSMADIVILESSGNVHVNGIFEAKLTKDDFDKELVEKDEEEEDKRRSKFIKNKYKKCKYQDEVAYYQKMLELVAPEPEPEPEPEPTDAELRHEMRMAHKGHRDKGTYRRSNSLTSKDEKSDEQGHDRKGGRRGLRRTKSSMEVDPPDRDRYRDRDSDRDKSRDRDDNHRDRHRHDKENRDRDREMSSSQQRERDRSRTRPTARGQDRRKDLSRAKSLSFDRSRPSGDRDNHRDNRRPALSKTKSSAGLDPGDGARNRRAGLGRAKSSFGLGDKDAPSARDRRLGLGRAKSSFGLGGDRRGGRRPPADKDKTSDFRSSAPDRVSLSDKEIATLLDDSSENNAPDKARTSDFRASAPERFSESDLLGGKSEEGPPSADKDRGSDLRNSRNRSDNAVDRRPADKDRGSDLRNSRNRSDNSLPADKDRGSDLRNSRNRSYNALPADKDRGSDLRNSRNRSDNALPADKDRDSNLRNSRNQSDSAADDKTDKRERRTNLLRAKSFSFDRLKKFDPKAGSNGSSRNLEQDASVPPGPFTRSRSMGFGNKSESSLLSIDPSDLSTRKSRSSSLHASATNLGAVMSEIPEKDAATTRDSFGGRLSRSFDMQNDGNVTKSASAPENEFSAPNQQSTDNPIQGNSSQEPELSLSDLGYEVPTDKLGGSRQLRSSFHGSTVKLAEPDKSAMARSRSMGLGVTDFDRPEKSGSKSDFAPQADQVASFADKRKQMSKSRSQRNSDKKLSSGTSPERREVRKGRLKGGPSGESTLDAGGRRQRSFSPLPRANSAPNTPRGGKRSHKRGEDGATSDEKAEESQDAKNAASTLQSSPRKPVSPHEASLQFGDLKNMLDQSDISNDPFWNKSQGTESDEKEKSARPPRQRTLHNSTPNLMGSLHESEDEANPLPKVAPRTPRRKKKSTLSDSSPNSSFDETSGHSKTSLGDWLSGGGSSHKRLDAKKTRTPRTKKKTVGEALGHDGKTPRSKKKTVGDLPGSRSPRRQKSMEAPKSPHKLQLKPVKGLTRSFSLESTLDINDEPDAKQKTINKSLHALDADKAKKDSEKGLVNTPGNRLSGRIGERRGGLVRCLSHESLLPGKDEAKEAKEKVSRNLDSLVDGDASKAPAASKRRGAAGRRQMRRALSCESLLVDPKDKDKGKDRAKPKERGKRSLHKSFAAGDSKPNRSRRNLHASFVGGEDGNKSKSRLDNLPGARKGRGKRPALVRSLSHESMLDGSKKDESKDEVSQNVKSLLDVDSKKTREAMAKSKSNSSSRLDGLLAL